MKKYFSSGRWQAEAVNANARFLEERWHAVTRQWNEARSVYNQMYHSPAPDVSELRRAARALYELEQDRTALKYALSA